MVILGLASSEDERESAITEPGAIAESSTVLR